MHRVACIEDLPDLDKRVRDGLTEISQDPYFQAMPHKLALTKKNIPALMIVRVTVAQHLRVYGQQGRFGNELLLATPLAMLSLKLSQQ